MLMLGINRNCYSRLALKRSQVYFAPMHGENGKTGKKITKITTSMPT